MAEFKSNIKVADEVMSEIATTAAHQVENVISVGDGIIKNSRVACEIKKENNGDLTVNATIEVKQGTVIKDVCKSVQEKIKDALESMLDIKVRAVNVRVAKLSNE